MNDARDVAEEGQQDVQEEVARAANLEPYRPLATRRRHASRTEENKPEMMDWKVSMMTDRLTRLSDARTVHGWSARILERRGR
jgi:hypothetical protein